MAEKILFVDDEPNVLQAYQRTLRKDFKIVAALGGREALELMESEGPFPVVVSDMNMPEMNGYRFLQEVRRTPTLEAIPAIMISTESKRVDMDQAFASGANLYMVKPIRPDAFSEILKLLFARAA